MLKMERSAGEGGYKEGKTKGRFMGVVEEVSEREKGTRSKRTVREGDQRGRLSRNTNKEKKTKKGRPKKRKRKRR